MAPRKNDKKAYWFNIQLAEVFEQDNQRILKAIENAFNVNGNDNIKLYMSLPTDKTSDQSQFKIRIAGECKNTDLMTCRQIFGDLKSTLNHSLKNHNELLSADAVLGALEKRLNTIKSKKETSEVYSLSFSHPSNPHVKIEISSPNGNELKGIRKEFDAQVKQHMSARQQREVQERAAVEAKGAYDPQENILVGTQLIGGRTEGQRHLISELNRPDSSLVFVDGPAGTGKTFLAVAKALADLDSNDNDIERIILLRPAFDAGGEKMAAVPGNEEDKIAGYMVPLVENLVEVMGSNEYKNKKQKNVIQILPVSYARGRTLKNAAVVIDESQNAADLPLLLGRVGEGSRYTVVGDRKQNDLPPHIKKTVKHSFGAVFDYYANLNAQLDHNEPMSERNKLRAQRIRSVTLTTADIVRSELCGLVMEGFEEMERLAELNVVNDDLHPSAMDSDDLKAAKQEILGPQPQ